MKISIITVVFNNVDTVAAAVESVIHQDYENIEYIIIDGESDDGTLAVLEEYKEHFTTFISEHDEGIYDAMNKGIKCATGDIVGLLHADDIFASSDIVNTINKQFESDASLMGVYGNIIYFSTNQNDIKRKWVAKDICPNYFEDGEIFPHTSFFVRKKVYDEIGYYKTKFRIGADYEFILRMIKVHEYKVKYINKTIVKMRLGGESTKNLSSIITSFYEVKNAWKMNNLSPPLSFYLKRYYKKIKQLV
jgi:glycosyltransferase